MDDRRLNDVPTDAALDREIERALAVDPSPDFVARVRSRIASEPVPSAWWHLRWPLVLAGAAAVVLAAVVLSTGRRSPSVTDSSPLAARPRGGLMALLAPDLESPGVGRVRSGSDVPDVIPASPGFSQILIDPGEAATLRRLMCGTRGGQIDPSTLNEHATTASAIQPLTDVVLPQIDEVPALIIPPLSSVAREEGVQQ